MKSTSAGHFLSDRQAETKLETVPESFSPCNLLLVPVLPAERERERKFNLSIQPALAYEDVSMLESSAKLRMAAKQ